MNEQPAPSSPEPADGAPSASAWRFDNCEFDTLEPVLRVGGRPVTVEPRPLRLLAELLQHCNEVLTKEELLESVWEGRPTVDHVLANAVSKLRTALGEAGAARLQTVPRVGYRFAGPVQRIERVAQALCQQAGQVVPGREGFVLERSLGRTVDGGVWLARHAKLGHRRVFKFAEDGARLTALKREYSLFRLLQRELGPREDIVKLVDANFTLAPFWLECESAGSSLLDWAGEGPPGGQLAALAVPERLGLFVQIARAVAAAHSVGVLHKDIKPANVLVGGSEGAWQARLTDFGSGRLLQPERLQGLHLTALGLTQGAEAGVDDRSGTLMYLAPELMAGHAPTVQSDLYALGMVLFQILVADLRRPLATGWQRLIDDELLRADIAAATEGSPAERLPSVADLVQRLEQLPQRRATQAELSAQRARAEAAALALQRTRARRPWVALAGLCLCAALLASLWGQREARRALARSEQAVRTTQAISDFLAQDVQGSPDVFRSGAQRPVSLMRVLHQASERAGQRFAGQPEREAAIRRDLGHAYLRAASPWDAWGEFGKAMALLEPKVDAQDPDLLALRLDSVRAQIDGTDLVGAREALAQVEALLSVSAPADDSALAFLAQRTRVELLLRIDFAAAVPQAQRLVALADLQPGLPTADRVDAYRALATAHFQAGTPALAETVVRRQASWGQAPDALAAVAQALATALVAARHRQDGQVAESQRLLQASLRRLERVDPRSELHIAYVVSDIAHGHAQVAEHRAARDAYAQALQAFEAALGDDHRFYRVTATNLARMDLALGRHAEVLSAFDHHKPWFDEQVRQGRSSGGPWSTMELNKLRALNALGRHAEALAFAQRLTSSPPQRDQDNLRWWRPLVDGEHARALVALGQYRQGAEKLRAALSTLQERGEAADVLAPYLQSMELAQRSTASPL